MTDKFSYIDEVDKCYGLTGMVISLNVLDSDLVIKHISVDNYAGESIAFTPDFCFCTNPRFSAKIAWNEIVKQYQLMVGMAVGNLLCRAYGNQRTDLCRTGIDSLHDLVAEDGRDVCSLDDDEIDVIFKKTLSYLNNVYQNRQVICLADRLVALLRKRRTLTGNEILDELHSLR